MMSGVFPIVKESGWISSICGESGENGFWAEG